MLALKVLFILHIKLWELQVQSRSSIELHNAKSYEILLGGVLASPLLSDFAPKRKATTLIMTM